MAVSMPPTPLPSTALLARTQSQLLKKVVVGCPIAVIIGVVWSRKE